MDTPLEDSNLAGIGSDEDKALREKAASLELSWEGAGEKVGIQIWRVENAYDDNKGVPRFGINAWPKKKYGDFHRGDSYIVLQTSKDEEGSFFWDVYFWIGSQSSQDEYGVAAYKANELDDLLGDAPVQHREVEGYESEEFMECFPKGVHYLEGGEESGFRQVDSEKALFEIPTRLLQIRKKGQVVRSFQVPLSCSSLNEGDVFLLDNGTKIFTWFGKDCSPFEKSHTAKLAHNISGNRFGHCKVEIDVEDDNDEFWSLLGGKSKIKPAEAFQDKDMPTNENKMYILTDQEGPIKITEVPPSKSNLQTDDVIIVDTKKQMFVWVGKGSTKREQSSAMLIVENYLKAHNRAGTTSVSRIMEGQRRQPKAFKKAIA
mmetsp:Transcript_47010/g.142354  ORF Transcript_47010/g.142354 Transcript_47010/m.142354 type:complete len:374 (-) Transcript_47010:170-1291(-)